MPNKLAELRKARGLTQEELAERVGVTRTHIAKIESGKFSASVRLLAKIAKVLDCSLDDIFLD